METISFMSANFVARELGYRMTLGWGQGDKATQDWFRPEAVFRERFGAMLDEVKALGFDAIDLWVAHLHPAWAAPRQIADAKEMLAARGMRVMALAGGLPADRELLRKTAGLAVALGAGVLAGGAPKEWLGPERAEFAGMLRDLGLVFGFENHPQKSVEEMLGILGAGDEDVIGIALDTGWCGTQGLDAAEAAKALAPRLKAVHLKDIRKPQFRSGPMMKDIGHETCALGDGVVPVRKVVEALKAGAFTGPVCIEHEPEEHSPAEDVRESLARVRRWLAA